MRRNFWLLLAAAAPVALTACNDSTGLANSVTPVVTMHDECDPASFNATLGAGACVRQGSVTLDQFNAQLAANQSVAQWMFTPTEFTMRVGGFIQAVNTGGETHTFTEVAQFGGGMVPALNSASGNPVEAPECADLKSTDLVASGGTFTTAPETEVGTSHYQCCIHPWMRATVTVTGT
jgi:plastocyanin